MNRNVLAGRINLPTRAVACSLMLATFFALNVPHANAASSSGESNQIAAENYVLGNLGKGLAILNDRGVSDAVRGAELRVFLNSLIDTRRLALFSLGPGKQSATPAEVNNFVNTFSDYALTYYETMLLKYYSGQVARVTGCNRDGSNDYAVAVDLFNPAQRQENQPIEVDFRVADDGGHFTVSDVAVAGVWLGQQERGRIYDYLLETNGNIGGVIARLKVSTERLETAPASHQQVQTS